MTYVLANYGHSHEDATIKFQKQEALMKLQAQQQEEAQKNHLDKTEGGKKEDKDSKEPIAENKTDGKTDGKAEGKTGVNPTPTVAAPSNIPVMKPAMIIDNQVSSGQFVYYLCVRRTIS